MYIWIGIDVDSQLSEIKERAQSLESEIGFENSNFTLPLHISLKISFFVPNDVLDAVKRDIIDIFYNTAPFSIVTSGVELDSNICWIMMHRNDALDKIHERLNAMLLEKYCVPLHEYDMDYKFHTTLFMDNDTKKVSEAYRCIRDMKIPQMLTANKFVIGTSDSGALGTYKVICEIQK